jgi:hypothetical protein
MLGGNKLLFCLVPILWISEFFIKRYVIYNMLHQGVYILRTQRQYLHFSKWIHAWISALQALNDSYYRFLDPKKFHTVWWVTPKNTINHDGLQIGKIQHPQTAIRHNGFEHPHYPRVEAGKNTSTVIPASRKREPSSLRWDSNVWLWVLRDSDHWQIALPSRQRGRTKTKSKAIFQQNKRKK